MFFSCYCYCYSKDFHSLLELTMNCGNLIGVSDTKEAWSYVVEVVQIIETKAKVSVNTIFMLSLSSLVHC